jgi:hypothetical protein
MRDAYYAVWEQSSMRVLNKVISKNEEKGREKHTGYRDRRDIRRGNRRGKSRGAVFRLFDTTKLFNIK